MNGSLLREQMLLVGKTTKIDSQIVSYSIISTNDYHSFQYYSMIYITLKHQYTDNNIDWLSLITNFINVNIC